jgi:hypothetical protein
MQHLRRDLVKSEHAGVVDMRVEHDGVVIPGDDEIGETPRTVVTLAGDMEE